MSSIYRSFSTLETTEDSWLSVNTTVHEYPRLGHTAGHNQCKQQNKKCSKIMCYIPWHNTQLKKKKGSFFWNTSIVYGRAFLSPWKIYLLYCSWEKSWTATEQWCHSEVLSFSKVPCQLQHWNQKQLFRDDFSSSWNNTQINTGKYINTSMNLKTISKEL